MEKEMTCYICRGKIERKNTDTYVLMVVPGGEFLPCHTRHHGVAKEYDKQVDGRTGAA